MEKITIMIITPQSELEAVNEILSSIGSSPVNSLEDDNNVDVINAKRLLEGVSREIQSRGWWFNTLDNIHLDPEVEGYGKDRKFLVPCPNSYIKFVSKGYKLLRREGYFLDQISNTMNFPEGLDIDNLVKLLDFSELPEAFRKYITVRAARIFQMRYLSAEELDQHLQLEESQAYSDLIGYELETGNYNIFDDEDWNTVGVFRGGNTGWL